MYVSGITRSLWIIVRLLNCTRCLCDTLLTKCIKGNHINKQFLILCVVSIEQVLKKTKAFYNNTWVLFGYRKQCPSCSFKWVYLEEIDSFLNLSWRRNNAKSIIPLLFWSVISFSLFNQPLYQLAIDYMHTGICACGWNQYQNSTNGYISDK